MSYAGRGGRTLWRRDEHDGNVRYSSRPEDPAVARLSRMKMRADSQVRSATKKRNEQFGMGLYRGPCPSIARAVGSSLPITSAGRRSPSGPRGIVSLPAEPQRGALLKVDDDHYEQQSDYDPKRNVAPGPLSTSSSKIAMVTSMPQPSRSGHRAPNPAGPACPKAHSGPTATISGYSEPSSGQARRQRIASHDRDGGGVFGCAGRFPCPPAPLALSPDTLRRCRSCGGLNLAERNRLPVLVPG
jgi:hypothetical protein